tara:strand:- start:43582 stop:43932 length:351 start_codon:yes stop_codon:yes gene_type:complete
MDPSVDTNKAILLMTNCSDEASAIILARKLLEQKLAACVNILPRVRSMYHWQGEIVSEDEFTVLIKTVRARYAELAQMINVLHPYEVPEIIALPIIAGSAEYLEWLIQETSRDEDV